MEFRKIIASRLPFLGKYKRWMKALLDTSLPAKETYSQYGEDKLIKLIYEQLEIPKDAVYIDVGANHPTDISNSYLLYRSGYNGIIIEPNAELVNLFKIFRKNDKVLGIGCSDRAQVLQFNISKTPVISSFVNNLNSVDVYKREYLPVLPLDIVVQNMSFKKIGLLSIDVEGLNYEVLNGATETLKQTRILCIEYDDDKDEKRIIDLVSPQMELVKKVHCNLIFVNNLLISRVNLQKLKKL